MIDDNDCVSLRQILQEDARRPATAAAAATAAEEEEEREGRKAELVRALGNLCHG